MLHDERCFHVACLETFGGRTAGHPQARDTLHGHPRLSLVHTPRTTPGQRRLQWLQSCTVVALKRLRAPRIGATVTAALKSRTATRRRRAEQPSQLRLHDAIFLPYSGTIGMHNRGYY